KLRSPMQMYDGQAILHGSTDLTPKGLTGAGLIDFHNATLESDLFEFTTMQLHSDTSNFRLTDGDVSSIAFSTDNVDATIKLDERVGEFVSNVTETKVEFPVIQYVCFMDRLKRYVDEYDIELDIEQTAADVSATPPLSG